jgi:hypothetical protein
VDVIPAPDGIGGLLAQPALPAATATLLAHANHGLDAVCRDAGWPLPLSGAGGALTLLHGSSFVLRCGAPGNPG